MTEEMEQPLFVDLNEIRRIEAHHQSDQNAIDGCILRVRALVAEIFGYERAMKQIITTLVFESSGSRYAQASCRVSRAEIEARGFGWAMDQTIFTAEG